MNQNTSIEELQGKPAPKRIVEAQTVTAISEARQVPMGFASMASFELMQRAAKLLSSSTLVPKSYQNNIPNCVVALNMAQRIGADPLMVMQNLYVVHGSPGWSAQFLIATFNQCGRFSSIKYDFSGDKRKDESACEAYATELSTGKEIRSSTITIALAKAEGWYGKQGSKWKTMPQQMLMYRSAAWLVRAYAPEIAMGLQTTEELHDVYDTTKDRSGQFVVESESVVDTVVADKPITDSAGEIFNETDFLDPKKRNQDGTFTKRPKRHKQAAQAQEEAPANSLTPFIDAMAAAKNVDELQEARDQANGPAVGLNAEQHLELDGHYRNFLDKLNGVDSTNQESEDPGAAFVGME